MATHTERAQALLDALKGDAVGAAAAGRILDDFAWIMRSQIEAAGLDPDNLTSAQKASAMLEWATAEFKRQIVKARVQKKASEYADQINAAGNQQDL